MADLEASFTTKHLEGTFTESNVEQVLNLQRVTRAHFFLSSPRLADLVTRAAPLSKAFLVPSFLTKRTSNALPHLWQTAPPPPFPQPLFVPHASHSRFSLSLSLFKHYSLFARARASQTSPPAPLSRAFLVGSVSPGNGHLFVAE